MTLPREVKEIRNDNGELVASFEYVAGKLDGTEKLWTSGTLVMEMQHANGEPHGIYKAWWDNGVRKQEGQFAFGKPVGKLRIYDEAGTLIEEQNLDMPSNKSLERTRGR